ncbi:hypothetical protein ACHAXR_008314 [Thalassiosira sp. AJA248-18]
MKSYLRTVSVFLLTTTLAHLLVADGLTLPSIQKHASRRLALSTISTAALTSLVPNVALADDTQSRKYQRYPSIRFIAALGDPKSSSGSGAETWGLWRDDPGPRGVYLKDYDRRLAANDNVAPAGWKFDPKDWWVEEHGLIMSTPEPLPRKSYNKDTKEVLPEKKYIVTGAREITTVLTVRDNGSWELEKGSLYDVTHLPCRSAAYRGDSCAPKNANKKDFPVKPGAAMPIIDGCKQQDYAVLFVLGEVA